MSAEMTAKLLQKHIKNTLDFLNPFLPMANCHMVTYITNRLWTKYVPIGVQREINSLADIEMATQIYWDHLSGTGNENDGSTEGSNVDGFENFRSFLATSNSHRIDNVANVWITSEELKRKLDNRSENERINVKGFMSSKKNHEVEIAADVIASVCTSHLNRNQKELFVIDAGDGKGYLSTRLSLEYAIKVLGVDYNRNNTLSASIRSEKLEVRWGKLNSHVARVWDSLKNQAEKSANGTALTAKQSRKSRRQQRKASNQLQTDAIITISTSTTATTSNNNNQNYKNITHFVTPQTDFVALFRENFVIDAEHIPGLCLTGLHTCGVLASSCLRIFAENNQISAVCNISCCYQLITEQFSQFDFVGIKREKSQNSRQPAICDPDIPFDAQQTYGFPMSQYLIDREMALGRNARMLACQPIHRTIDQRERPHNHLFFRALLEVLIQRRCPEYLNRIEVGKLKMCTSFAEYVRKAVKRNPWLQFNDISDDELNKLPEEFALDEKYLHLYFLMRVSLAAVVESFILLDRFLYLKEFECGGKRCTSHLVRFFDPVVSPRCYGIVAMKF